jgi:hypothetical protein
MMGGAVGGVVGGVSGAMAGFGMLGSVAMGLAGMFLGANFLAPLLAGISPMILVPAALVGGGLLLYSWFNRRPRYGTAADQRFQDGPFDSSLFNAQSRLANQSQTGSSGSQQAGSFLDRFRSILDGDRRDDHFWWDQRYVDSNGYVRNNPDFWGKLDIFFNGRNGGAGYGDLSVFGIGQGNTQYLSPTGNVRTDQAGRVAIGSTSTVQSVQRVGLAPQAPTSETATAGETVERALTEAEARRKAAYGKLVEALKRSKSQTAAPGVESKPRLTDPEVLEAIREYREADREIKELTERLQPREKQ